jgi:hypothetical protein
MTPEPVQAPDPEAAPSSTFSRISGVFFEPGKTFADIGRKPSWFAPLLLSIVAALAFYATYGQRVGWERYLQQQIATNPRAQQQMDQIPADRREQQMAIQAKFIGIGFYVSAIFMLPIIMLVSSAILLGLTAMMSAGLKFKQVFAIVCFAGMPMVIKQLLSVMVVFLKNPDDFNLMNPLAFNFAAFMDPMTASKFLYTFALSFDLFAVWVIILTALGLSAAAGKRKLSFGGALFAVCVPWVVFVTFGGGMAAMFS